jgi:hypothetical protein
MPAPDVLELLREHDLARGLQPATAEARERLRRSIVAAPAPAPPSVRRLRRSRARLALAAAALALVLTTGGWAFYSAVLDTPETVQDDFADVTETIPLPPGASWEQPKLDGDALYGRRAALMIALGQATCAWLGYWSEGDSAQRAQALAGFRQVRALMPLHRDGEPEEAGGYDAGSLAYVDSLIAEAERGQAATVEQYLAANCS